MSLTIDEVRRIASLARLRLTPEEEELYTRQLGEIVHYIDQLAGFEGAEVVRDEAAEPARRPDRSGECLPRETFLANAPAELGGFLLVPEVKGDSEDG